MSCGDLAGGKPPRASSISPSDTALVAVDDSLIGGAVAADFAVEPAPAMAALFPASAKAAVIEDPGLTRFRIENLIRAELVETWPGVTSIVCRSSAPARIAACDGVAGQLSGSASFHSLVNNEPSKPGIKHLGSVAVALLSLAGVSAGRSRPVLLPSAVPPDPC